MNSITFAFLVTTIAGLSTLIGMVPIYLKFKNIDNVILISLAFAAGVMLSVSLISLIPESYHLIGGKSNPKSTIILMIIFILVGVFLSSFIDKLFRNLENKLYKIGIINTIALMLHNIPEGILTFSTTTTNVSLGITLALSILFHNIPEGISISVPIYYSTNSKSKAFFYTAISGFSEILGAVFTYLFLFCFITNNFIGIMLAMTTGIMTYISLFELLPNSLEYRHKKTSYISFIIGFIFMMLFK